MEGERARVFQAERTASGGEGGVLKGDTITPALETLGEKTPQSVWNREWGW